jgi:chaperone modulatory protein CbpM
MTMHLDELVEVIDHLCREDLEAWMRNSLVHATGQPEAPVFSEAECARVRMICSLHYDMEIDAEVLPVILELVDQLHETRRQLHALGAAVLEQDEEVRSAILSRLKPRGAARSRE